MSEISDLQRIAGEDQTDAALERISAAVARHYAALTGVGMSAKHATSLCRDMQEQWLSGVVPVNPFMQEMMAEGEGE